MDFQVIHCLVLDVDGVLTPGDVTFDDRDGRSMAFSIHDGQAMKIWQRAGGQIAIITGRSTPIVDRRAKELGIDAVYQGVSDKARTYQEFLTTRGYETRCVCCVGDDLPDVALFSRCGFAVAPANAVPTVKRFADFVTRRPGGQGAVAETIELILRKQRRWIGHMGVI